MEREQRNKEWIAQRDFNRKHNRKIFQRFNGDPLFSPDKYSMKVEEESGVTKYLREKYRYTTPTSQIKDS